LEGAGVRFFSAWMAGTRTGATQQLRDRPLPHGHASVRATRYRESVGARGHTRALDLTAQEGQIARLASRGLSNPEIAGRVFLSTRTIEYRMHVISTKLRVTSRTQLTAALSTWSRGGAT
jgi:DNA-binding NarL/FixJ family response regulator